MKLFISSRKQLVVFCKKGNPMGIFCTKNLYARFGMDLLISVA